MKITKERLKQIILEEVGMYEAQEKEMQVGSIISYLIKPAHGRSNYRIDKVPDEASGDYEMTKVEIDDEGNITGEMEAVTIPGGDWQPIQVRGPHKQHNRPPNIPQPKKPESGYPKWMR
jgi:hypothetical protein|tara:strand:- start:407 stop:763 length:357 start_codon:yes stop_codon:yes gene_type:complete